MKALAVACMAALATVGACQMAPAQPATARSRPWLVGYYPEYQRDLLAPDQIDWTALTHLAVARVVPRADGSLDTTFDVDQSHGPALARDLAARARAHGVVPLLMVGGDGTHDGFAAAASDHRTELVTNLIGAMRAYGFAGLDLDWEPVTNGDRQPLAELVSGLRQAAPKAVLTMPVAWVTTTFPDVPTFYAKLARQLDRLDIMTYGMAGKWDGWKTWHTSAVDGASPSTPSSIAVNVRSYLAAGVPAAKLAVGVGFYGMCWRGGVSGPGQDIGSSFVDAQDNIMSYTNIMASYYEPAAYRYDTTAQAPYLSFSAPHGPQECTFVSYENGQSIAAKGAYARTQGLGGAIVWTINQGPVGLLKATRSAFGA